MFDIKGGASAIVTGGHPAAGVFDVNDALRTSQKSRDVYDMVNSNVTAFWIFCSIVATIVVDAY